MALGTAAAGFFATYYDPDHEAPHFITVGGLAVVFGLVVAVSVPAIRKLMPGVH